MSIEHPSFENISAADLPEWKQEQEPSQAASFERGFVWESKQDTINEAEARVRESLEALAWPEDKMDEFLLAVREAVTNSVMHGNLEIRRNEDEPLGEYDERRMKAMDGDAGKKKVNMEIYASEPEVRVVITDEGDFVPSLETTPDSTGDDRIMMPSGRGMRKIFGFCDKVEAKPGQLTLIKYRDGGGGVAEEEDEV